MNQRYAEIQDTYVRSLAEGVIAAFQWRKINGFFAQSRSEALTRVMDLIPSDSTVSQGGSMTVEQLGVRDALKRRGDIQFLDPYDPDLSREAQLENRRKGMLADVFVTGTNAITRDGILVNRDGMGNRTAALHFGPGRVVIVAGINKIVQDIDAAVGRIDQVAAPMNCERLDRDTPCRKTLQCHDCQTSDRICCVTSIIERQMDTDRLHVILLGEPLGF